MVVGGGRLLPWREEKGRKEGTGGCFEGELVEVGVGGQGGDKNGTKTGGWSEAVEERKLDEKVA